MDDFNPIIPHPRPQDLVGKTAVVTGGSKGIGRSIVLNLARRGCNVLATFSSPDSSKLVEEMAKTIEQDYATAQVPAPRIIGLQADITSPDCPTLIASAVEEHFNSKVNILVNNAAITGGSKIGHTTADQVQRKLLANVQTPFLLVEELVRRKMFRPNSRIINISSDRARISSIESVVYSASKAALESLTRTWAKALGGNEGEYAFMAGTTANSVSVGAVETEQAKTMDRERLERRLGEELKRQVIAPEGKAYFAQCEEVADVVGMLCSREARWITGAVIPANGGAIMVM